MSDFEDKLQSILGNPQAMDQIMSIARSLGAEPPPQEEHPCEECCSPAWEPTPGTGEPLAALSGLDPRLVQMGMRLLGEYNRSDNQTVALLHALQPFLRPERYAKVDKAVQIAKLSRVIRVALDSLRKGDADFV